MPHQPAEEQRHGPAGPKRAEKQWQNSGKTAAITTGKKSLYQKNRAPGPARETTEGHLARLPIERGNGHRRNNERGLWCPPALPWRPRPVRRPPAPGGSFAGRAGLRPAGSGGGRSLLSRLSALLVVVAGLCWPRRLRRRCAPAVRCVASLLVAALAALPPVVGGLCLCRRRRRSGPGRLGPGGPAAGALLDASSALSRWPLCRSLRLALVAVPPLACCSIEQMF